jgi:signal peptide peptidase-like protein 2B
MIKVATGGSPKADPTYCEKYPSDRDCQTREQLPMLLTLPRIGDYQGGSTMLGLGDIILPGLLVAFAARYDRASGVPLCRGYFRLMVLGYAVGLMMANMAVYLMQMGQPALLYLVPCTLGLFALVAWGDGTLKQMWDGPPALVGSDARPPSPPKTNITMVPNSQAGGGEAPMPVVVGAGAHGHGHGHPQQAAGRPVGPPRMEEEPLLDL